MPVGHLIGLASQVTLASGNSASVTVPNDGSVTAGDLLLVGCVMPSGSRTFAISGGSGSWTSLGAAAQSGHTSETWWKIAQAGDLGATVTVTPSTGGIRQVLLLGKVSGVHPSAPIFGSQRNTSASATTKTTPTVPGAPGGCREVSIVWDTRGASTPQTSTWTAPTGETRQLQAFTTSGSGSCSGAMGDSDALVSGTVGGRVWTADQTALGSAWTIVVAGPPQTAALAAGRGADRATAVTVTKRAALGAARAVERALALTVARRIPLGAARERSRAAAVSTPPPPPKPALTLTAATTSATHTVGITGPALTATTNP